MCSSLGNLYAVQQGIGAAKGDDEAKAYIVKLMDQLDQV